MLPCRQHSAMKTAMDGADIRARRTRLGLTQTELAEAVVPPLDRHKISKLEKAERIAPGMAARLREAFVLLGQKGSAQGRQSGL
jgi:transcriptional regulator with XRE-family HTH domain